jgi:N-acetylglucosamine-6-phosphate deacetylase
MMTLANARIVQPHGVLDGWIRVSDGRIEEIGPGTPPGAPEHDLGGALVVPGFVDIHVHGGAGGSFPSGDHGEARKARAFHLEHGTTTTVASLVTASLLEMTKHVGLLAELCEEGLLAGVHLEGPYLAPSRCGAHQPDLLRAPDRAELAALLDAGRGQVRVVTVAPELVSETGRTTGVDLVRDIVAWGAVAAVGHTEATYEQARAAFDAGATVATHLFNAMRPLHHREPGPVGAALENPMVTVELINDGVHVADSVARLVFAAADNRVALVTDAMPAAGLGDGDYRLGPMEVTVRDGRATLAGGTSIAGSTITMAAAFRRAVRELQLSVEVVAEAAALTPARVLGLADEIGSLEAGKRADLVVLDDDLEPAAVMRAGTWVRPPSEPDGGISGGISGGTSGGQAGPGATTATGPALDPVAGADLGSVAGAEPPTDPGVGPLIGPELEALTGLGAEPAETAPDLPGDLGDLGDPGDPAASAAPAGAATPADADSPDGPEDPAGAVDPADPADPNDPLGRIPPE